MKIVNLQVENFKKIKAIEITPEGNTLIVSGKNGQGKTSILDAICIALGGKEALKQLSRPIRDGEDHAKVVLTTEDYIITRTWTANDKSYLTVENKDGMRASSPQDLLNSFIGKLSFDPLEFTRLDNKKQREVLLGLLDLPIDLDVLRENYKKIFDTRTTVNRDLKTKQIERDSILLEDIEKIPDEEVVLSDLTQQLEKAMSFNEEMSRKKENLKGCQSDIVNAKREIEQMQLYLETRIKDVEKLEKEIGDGAIQDTTPIQVAIKESEGINRNVRAKKERLSIEWTVGSLQEQADGMTKELEKIVKTKDEAIKSSNMPIEGLGIDDEGVIYHDMPFTQLSSAEQLKVSLSIAMASNPKLRAIMIRDGSLLDKDNFKVIEEMAKDQDFLVIIEKVDETGKVGVYIEDGEVKNG